MAKNNVTEWLNENSFRSYPLAEGDKISSDTDLILSDKCILDALIVSTSDTASLTQLLVDTTHVTFTIDGQLFQFLKAESFPQYLRINTGSLLVVGSEVLNIPTGVYTFDIPFESTVVYKYTNDWLGVNSVTINSNTYSGDIILSEGYQIGLLGHDSNILEIKADSIFGKPIGCLRHTDNPDNCATIISFINGATSNNDDVLLFLEGNQVKIVDDPSNHRLFIVYGFQASDICQRS